jgi:glycosylphosphatidylinositol transamidase (GPIT) subunit GPI8
MELVQAYRNKMKISNLHYITMESVISRVWNNFKHRRRNKENILLMVEECKKEMLSRNLDRYFILKLDFSAPRFKANISDINVFNPPKECVQWSW